MDSIVPLNLNADVKQRLIKVYTDSDPIVEQFYWLWNELRKKVGKIGCCTQKRYIGLYSTPGCNELFCYVDPQQHAIEFAVDDKYKSAAISIGLRFREFSDWNHKGMIAFSFKRRNARILAMLCYCCQRRRGINCSIRSFVNQS